MVGNLIMKYNFGAFCDANSITHNFSASRTPQSNGVVERKNLTLQEMSRTMLKEQSIPQKFLCNAVDTSKYILNRILIRHILGKTSYELFKGKKPSLEYFKVSDSKCFILNTKDYLTKFDPKSTEDIFLGYLPNSKAYVILNKETMRVEESLNVRFDESPPLKSSHLVDDIIESQIIENQIEDIEIKENEPLNKEIVNIKETKDHPIDSVICKLNERTLRSQVQSQKTKLDLLHKDTTNKKEYYDKTYAPVARLESIRILLAYACAHDFKNFQIDVKSAFLNGFINEEFYVAQPPGFVDFEKPNHVFKLKKALYGLKQDPKLDDIIFGSTCQDLCDDFSKIIHSEFQMSMMDELNFFHGLQIKQLEDGIFFNQSKYIKEMLKKFGLEDSKPIKTPMSSETKFTRDEDGESVDDTKYRGMIGSLLYLTASRPDIMFSVCLCAYFLEVPKTSHLEAVKRIFRYIKGTTHLGLWYPKGTGVETIVYADSDHAGDYVNRKSTSGVCAFMGYCLTSWFSKKQTAQAISTTEAEYVFAGKACQQALWMKQALVDYDLVLDDIPILCDNKGAIDLSKNPVLHSRTKHIEIRHHFLRDNVQKGNISNEKVSSEDNIADILTKPSNENLLTFLD
ncbi:retrovirus-related pol polyprotein from transposon TNT 1-94 [Tanacetum coccineum]